MSSGIKRYFAVVLALVVLVSGMNNMTLSIPADDLKETSTVVEEMTTEPGEEVKETATGENSAESVTEQEDATTETKEEATVAKEEATNVEENTNEMSSALEEAKKPVEQILDTPFKAVARASAGARIGGLGRYEAEEYDSITKGDSSNIRVGNDNFSGGKYVADLNQWAADGRAYITKKVTCQEAGNYKIVIGYTSGNDADNDKNKPTHIDIRVNGGEWKSITAAPTDSWDAVSTVSETINLNSGENTIDVTGACNIWYGEGAGNSQWVNLDYFDLTAAEVEAEGRHEAEYADSYTKGGADNVASINIDRNNAWYDKFSEKGYVGNMNTYPTDDEGKDVRSYLTQKVNAKRAGKYMLTIGYAYRNNGGDSSKPTNIDVRVNGEQGGQWNSITAYQTDDWNDVKEVSTVIELKKGENIINITGASNIWYAGGDYWQQVNLDYFDISSPLAEGRHEAEAYHDLGGSSSSEQYKVKDNGGENYSEGKYLTILNSNDREYAVYNIYAQHAGNYRMDIAYGTRCNGNIFIKVGDGAWQELNAPSTGAWDTVKTVGIDIKLPKGENKIYIAGYQNGAIYSDYINLDYFNLERKVDTSNIALDKPVRTSGDRSDQSGDTYRENAPEEAVDGYDDSRWGGLGNQSENWFEIDLEAIYEINQVMLKFERAYPKDFEIQISRDRNNWTTTETVKDWTPSGNDEEQNAKYEWNSGVSYHGKARYIRINATKLKNTSWGLSIWEFVVKGDKLSADVKDVAVNKTASASSSNNNGVELAVDGKDDSRWGSTQGNEQWYQVNLGKEYALESFDLKFERAYPEDFVIKTSMDGTSWDTVKTVSGWNNPGSASNLSKDARLGYSFKLDTVKNASYIRIESKKAANSSWGLSMWEFEAWGKETDTLDYWREVNEKKYGIYPVDKLYDKNATEKSAHMNYADGSGKDYTILNADLVQGDVLATNDVYQVVYEPGKDNYIYFYVNPRDTHISFGTDENNEVDKVRWSGNSKDAQSVVNDKWGANDYDSNIAEFCEQKAATVKYRIKDLGDKESATTEIGCQIYGTTDGKSDLGVKDPKFSIKIKLQIVKTHSLTIEDTLEDNGHLSVKNAKAGIAYKWQRSSDGENNWQDVAEKRDDLQVISNNGASLDVSYDMGGGMYYRVSEADKNEWSLPYKVAYYNNVQNGDFETPAMCTPGETNALFPFNANGDEQQYPNGYPGMFWKTTGPGWESINQYTKEYQVGHDIEIVNGRNLKVKQADQEHQFSVTYDEMYKDSTHGDQFAELNCENIGALYQDILTTPTSECYWDLDHAGRWNQNAMYVVAMAAKDAKQYMTSEQLNPNNGLDNTFIKKIKSMDDTLVKSGDNYAEGTEVTLQNGVTARVWKVRSESVTAGHWEHHRGMYQVPNSDKNHLTRFFFVSVEGGGRTQSAINNGGDLTVGNLLDNVTFEMKKSYSIIYKVQGYDENGNEENIEYEITGVTVPGGKVVVPNSFEKNGRTYDLSNYTLTTATMNDEPYYYNNTGQMTVEYKHDALVLVYQQKVITVTKIIDGLEENNIPDNYQVTFEVAKVGSNNKKEITLTKDKFKLIETENEEEEGRLFASGTIPASQLNLQNGDKYTVVEKMKRTVKGADNKNYSLIQITDSIYNQMWKVSANAPDDYSYSINEDGIVYQENRSNSATITNFYNPTYKITVKKKVTGTFGDREKEFDFTVTLSDAAVGYDANKVSSEGFTYKFKLKHDEETTFEVPEGCKADISEADYTEAGYSTTWNANTGNVVVNEDKTFLCTNDCSVTPTGLKNNAKPFTILIGCALLALICFGTKRKDKLLKRVKRR